MARTKIELKNIVGYAVIITDLNDAYIGAGLTVEVSDTNNYDDITSSEDVYNAIINDELLVVIDGTEQSKEDSLIFMQGNTTTGGVLGSVVNNLESTVNSIVTGSGRRQKKVIAIVDNTASVLATTGDRYILDFTAGTVNASWNGANKGDIVEYDGVTWIATTPEEGMVVYVDNDNKDALYVDDGTPEWQLRPVAVTNHSDLTFDDGTNPHGTTKADVGLGNVDNTSDADKPVSTATQLALDGKANTVHTHTAADITDFDTEVSNNTNVSANTTKLSGIEANATADQTASEVPVTPSGNLTSTDVQSALQELQGDIDALPGGHDAVTLGGVANDTTDDTLDLTGQVLTVNLATPTTDGAMSAADKSKLDGVESGATADQTAAEIKTAYESNLDTNAFTDAEQTKLSGIADGAEVNVNADWNAVSGDAQILNKPTDLTDLSTHTADELSGVSATNATALGNLSGVNTGDQDLSGYVQTTDIDTLAELNTIITDATLIDTTDSRLSDARTPTAHTHTASEITDFDTEVSNNTDVTNNTAKVSADGSVTTHSDVDNTTTATLKNNLNASVAPTATDDSGSGYAVGSIWIDTTADKSYILVDSTATAAVWVETTADTIYTHPNHTGEVTSTGDGAQVLDSTAITNKTTVTAVSGDFVLISDTSDSGNLKKVDANDFLTGGGGGLGTKAGHVAAGSFTGDPRTASVTFTTAFADANYTVNTTAVVNVANKSYVTQVLNKSTTGFTITLGTGSVDELIGVDWTATKYGES